MALDDAPKKPPRNIVLCFDGTGDWFASGQTNVAKIFSALDRDTQVVFYDGGIGTLTDWRSIVAVQRVFLKMVDLASATSLREKVLNGYLFLVEHYQPGDRIFMFGFSRGAYTARLVASMLRNFGLLRKDAVHLAPYLWQTLTSAGDRGGQGKKPSKNWEAYQIAKERIREGFCLTQDESPVVDFLGLFDTVSSVGVVGRFQIHPNTDHNELVQRVCHAVAMDEERNAFPQQLMGVHQANKTEVWFPGVHRDVGGGLTKNDTIANAALGWMADEAVQSGLRLTEKFPLYDPNDHAPVVGNFPTFDPYVFFGLYPMQIFSKRFMEYRLFWPNFRHVRSLPENALVHEIAKAMPKDPKTGRWPDNWPRDPVWYPENQEPRRGDEFEVREIKPSLAALAGMVIGLPFIVLLWNSAMGSPFKDGWPIGSKPFVVVVLFLVIVLQGLGRPVYAHLPGLLRPRQTPAIVAGAMLVLGLVWFWFPPERWPIAWIFAALALPLWVWGQVYPLGRTQGGAAPALPMDRILASVLHRIAMYSVFLVVLALLLTFGNLMFLEIGRITGNVWVGACVLAFVSGILYALNEIGADRVAMKKSRTRFVADRGDRHGRT